jgi:hypothetical protein
LTLAAVAPRFPNNSRQAVFNVVEASGIARDCPSLAR